MKTRITLAALLLAFAGAAICRTRRLRHPGDAAVKAAKHAVTAYRDEVVDTLAKLVSFNTVADKDVPVRTQSPAYSVSRIT
jgi:dipeptidase D